MFKSAVLLTTGNIINSLMLLVRNVVVARLISVEDFGVAATFAITMAFIEMMTQLGMDWMIVQDKDGDKPRMQSSLQAFQAMRGVIAGILMFAIAGPYAALLGVSDIVWAYQLIALVPVVRGFIHFDVHRLKREMNFMPFVAHLALPAMLSVLAAYLFSFIWNDWRIMLYALLTQHVLMLVISHMVAERRYSFVWDMGLMKRAFIFGWPLLINGGLLFIIFNGEKIIVGRELGMVDLALFAMMFTLTLTPTLVLQNSTQSFFLPQLSNNQDNLPEFTRLSHVTLQFALLITVVLTVGIALLGPPVVGLLLGEKYYPGLSLLVWLAIVQGIRVAKVGGAAVSLARAFTNNAMIANGARVLAMPIAWVLVTGGYGLMAVIILAIVAETIGYFMSLYLVKSRVKIDLGPLLIPLILTGLTLALIALDLVLYPPQNGAVLDHAHWFQLTYIVAGIAAMASMKEAIGYVRRRANI